MSVVDPLLMTNMSRGGITLSVSASMVNVVVGCDSRIPVNCRQSHYDSSVALCSALIFQNIT